MDWRTIKKIYIEVLVRGAKIEYMGNGKCKTVRPFVCKDLIVIKYDEFGYHSNINGITFEEIKTNWNLA